ncbi:hypothetical protein [Mucilaginibacter sp.]
MTTNQNDLSWFKQTIEPQLVDYEVSYRYFDQGDFGSLSQVVIEGKSKGGQMDYWGLGWLGIFLWDYINKKELINILLTDEEQEKHDQWLNELVTQLIEQQ